MTYCTEVRQRGDRDKHCRTYLFFTETALQPKNYKCSGGTGEEERRGLGRLGRHRSGRPWWLAKHLGAA